MNRRTAVKSIGLGMGYTLSAGAFISFVQSCQSAQTVEEVATKWAPRFFKEGDTQMTGQLLDLILPKTDTPSATEAGVLEIMDNVIHRLFKSEDKDTFATGLDIFNARLGKEGDLKEKMLGILTGLSEMPEEKMEGIMALLNKEKSEITSSEMDDYHYYKFLSTVREMGISSYFSSELIGKDHLAYLPVPGVYEGCIDVDEKTKSWSF